MRNLRFPVENQAHHYQSRLSLPGASGYSCCCAQAGAFTSVFRPSVLRSPPTAAYLISTWWLPPLFQRTTILSSREYILTEGMKSVWEPTRQTWSTLESKGRLFVKL